jgi:hypothetical protein
MASVLRPDSLAVAWATMPRGSSGSSAVDDIAAATRATTEKEVADATIVMKSVDDTTAVKKATDVAAGVKKATEEAAKKEEGRRRCSDCGLPHIFGSIGRSQESACT